ncbi:Xanthine dehydrogenase [Armadillidium vulgare]|nr:Xanthine dehydrogenase [Armadillidium vulgare]
MLQINASSYLVSLDFSCPKTKFFRTSSLRELLELKNAHNDAVIIVGNAKIGIQVLIETYITKRYPKIIHPVNTPELTEIKMSEKFFEIGAAASVSDIESFIKEKINEIPESKAKILVSIKEMLQYFADRQIKNVASVAGSIMTGFSESDFNTILVASKTKLVFQNNQREVLFDENFLENHLKNIANSKEVLVTIKIPLSTENEYFRFYKQSRRKGKDLAIVNAAFKISFDFPSQKITDIIIALGSIKHTTMLATKTMQSLRGQKWSENVLNDATSFLVKELKELDIDNTMCKPEYKVGLAASFFFKFYLFVCEELHKKFPVSTLPLKEEEKLLTEPDKHIPTKSTQFFQNVPEDQEKIDPVGRPVPHVSALKQTTGEATYVDDIPRFENELYAALILSEKARAKIVKIDPSEALKMEGVRAEQNITGYLMKDEEVFASKEVRCVGQIIGVVVAETMELAEEARKIVRVQYEDISQPILSIEEAIKANSVWEPLMVEIGNLDEGFKNSKHVLEGESRTGFQEHFYMETNTHIAVPYDNDEIHLIGTHQSPSQTQMIVAHALNLEANRVYCKVKRVGGGFGGKESRHLGILIPIALAAMKTGRPVRICLSRKDDMIITGGRNPVLAKWKVGFEEDGKLNALDVSYYLNAGYSLDLTDFVRKMMILKANNGYHIENLRARGQSCKTNLPSNTAFRGFGTPQAIFVMENIIVQIAEFLGMDPNKLREKNMYDKLKSFTHYGQEITHNTLRNCWEQILLSSNYTERKSAVDKFNRENVYKKRGISAMPLMFGIGFTIQFMHQAGALIMVYTDGSVLLSHGGVELGQGLDTKMLQIASRVLEIPIERIYIAEASTDKVPNTIPTVASTASDLNGMAVLDACRVIQKRLEPYKSKMADKSWNDWVQAAYMDRVSLSATGYYKTPNIIEYDFENQIAGDPYVYFSFGSGVSEVEIDCLTGDHMVLRTDIIMDVGKSLNPAIDIGQIEGAFMQGYGLFTLEELVFSSSGELLTTGPDSYKIPGNRGTSTSDGFICVFGYQRSCKSSKERRQIIDPVRFPSDVREDSNGMPRLDY